MCCACTRTGAAERAGPRMLVRCGSPSQYRPYAERSENDCATTGKGVIRVLTIFQDIIKLIGDLLPLVLPLLGL